MQQSEAQLPKQPYTCVSCGQEFTGTYCPVCGEKVLQPEHDFSFKHFAEETLEGLTHFDGKFFRSLKLLVLRPGQLSLENVQGKRIRTMRPFQLFLVISLMFYFLLSHATSFYSNAYDLVRAYAQHNHRANTFGADAQTQLNRIAAEQHLTTEQAVERVHHDASQKSKTFLLVLIPFLALLQYLLFRRAYDTYFPHLIFATHVLTFFIFLDLVFIGAFKISGSQTIGDNEVYFLLFLYFIYLTLAIRTFYHAPVWKWLFGSVFTFSGFVLLLLLYRQAMTLWSLFTL